MLELAIFMAYKDRRINLISNSPNLISTQDSTLGTVYRLEFQNVFLVQAGISFHLFFFFVPGTNFGGIRPLSVNVALHMNSRRPTMDSCVSARQVAEVILITNGGRVFHQWRMGVLSPSFIFHDQFKDSQKPSKSCIFIVGMFYNSYIHFRNITKTFSIYITQ